MTTQFLVLMLCVSMSAFADEKGNLPLPPSGDVTLTLDEYNRLVALAGKPSAKTDTPPVAAAIKHADLKLRVAENAVLGSIQLDGETLHRGVTRVPLVNGLTILDARQNGKSLPLEQHNGGVAALLTGPGEFGVAMEAGIPLNVEAGRAAFNLPVPAAGSARMSLVVPGDHTNIHLSPGVITNRVSENGTTTIEAVLVPGVVASLWWTTREITVPTVPREARFLADVKTLVTINDTDIKLAVLADVNVVQGEPAQFSLDVPAGYEVTGVTGASLDTSEVQAGTLVLKIAAPAQKSHQFLITMEKPLTDTKADAPFLGFQDAQRETGEVLVEGTGTLELTAKEGGSLKRMDLKEASTYLRSLSRHSQQAAFRYHRQATEPPTLALEWVRFPDSSVLAALAEEAEMTTLVTSEGKSLTEVKLTLKNQAQPFLKVALPAGATILSAEVAGEKVKPVQGADGSRVPLLRPGFRPNGPYIVSFVFLHSGAPFAKKGGSEISLPKMDVPLSLLRWEVFLPEQYRVKDFGGDAFFAPLVPAAVPYGNAAQYGVGMGAGTGSGAAGGIAGGALGGFRADPLYPGQIGGFIVDSNGAAIAGARVTVTSTETGAAYSAVTNEQGSWTISGVPSGNVKISAEANGFRRTVFDSVYDASRPSRVNFPLSVGAIAETVTVMAYSADRDRESQQIEKDLKKQVLAQQNAPSANVTNLQRRVAGVLPVAVDVPRAGNSYRFVRPLVLDEETKVTFSYKTK